MSGYWVVCGEIELGPASVCRSGEDIGRAACNVDRAVV